jgi:hypothetical protein
VELQGHDALLHVELRNAGDAEARELRLYGRLGDDWSEARLAKLGAGSQAEVSLRFRADVAEPGIHAVPLLVEFHAAADAPDRPFRASRLYVMLQLGPLLAPALRVFAPRLVLSVQGFLEVGLESADALPHRVRVSVLPALGLSAPELPAEVQVPAFGRASVPIRLLSAGSAFAGRNQVLVIASVLGEPAARDAVATAVVDVVASPPLFPRLRRPLLVVGLGLLLLALGLEARARLARGRPPGGAGGPP